MGKALRYTEGKPQLAYMLEFGTAMEALARIFEFGACKYNDGNWKLGGKPDREYLNSLMRHLRKWKSGEEFDADSGCSHLGHAVWNLCALLELNYPESIIDEELFKERCAFWLQKKKEADENQPPIYHSG